MLEGLAAIGLYLGILLLTTAAIAFLANRPDRGRRLLAAGLVALVVGAAGPATVNYILYGEREGEEGGGGEGEGRAGGVLGAYVVSCPPERVVADVPVEVVVATFGLDNRTRVVVVEVNETRIEQRVGPQELRRIPLVLGEGRWSVTVYADGRPVCSVLVEAVSVGSRVAGWFEEAASRIAAELAPRDENFLVAAFKAALAWLLENAVRAAGYVFAAVAQGSTVALREAGVAPSESLYYLVVMPTFDAPGLRDMYVRVLGYAAALLPAAIVAGLVWRVYWRGEELDLLELGKELLWALAVMVLAPSVYDPLARIYNAVALSIAQLGQANIVYAEALALTAMLAALSPLLPYAGTLAAAATLAMAGLAVAGLLKWLLASAVVAVSPLLAVAYLVPPLRRAVDTAATLLAQLWVASLLASALTGMASAFYLGGGGLTAIAYAIVLPAVYTVMLPAVLGYIGIPFTEPLKILAAPLRAAPAAAIPAPGPQTPTTTPTPAPTTPPTAPARRVPDIAEILAATRPLRMKYLRVEPVKPAAAPTVQEAARPRIEEVQVRHPRAYAIGSRIGDVAARALSGLEQRARLFAAGYLSALERELGIKLPERLKPKPLTPEDVETRRYVVSGAAAKAADIAAEAAKRATERAKRYGGAVVSVFKNIAGARARSYRDWS